MEDPFDLARFVAAQDGVIASALAELRVGHKRGHWMWFVFPQLAGLGLSAMARRYAITGLSEAQAYLSHPVLGPRLHGAVGALLATAGNDAEAILGPVDAVKLRSSMTLFARAGDEAPFRGVLERFYDGRDDPATLRLLGL